MVDPSANPLHPNRALVSRFGPPVPFARAEAIGWGATVIVVGLAVVRRWLQMGPFPTGLDGGQWLALGRGLTGFGRSTDGAYAPLVPVLTAAAASLAGPMTGLKIVAMLSLVATLIGTATLARLSLIGLWQVGLVAGAASATAVTEPLAYGGYPQLLALGAMLAATAVQAQSLVRPSPGRRVTLAALLLVAVVAHHVYGPLALICAAAVWAWHLAGVPAADRTVRGACDGLLPLLPASAVALVVLAAFRHAGYAPPLDASGLGRRDAFLYATREAPLLWVLVAVVAVVALAARPRLSEPWWLASAGLLAVPGLLFLVAPEPRLLPPALIGALVVALRAASRASWARPARLATGAVAIAVLMVLMFAGDAAASRYFAFYRVASPSLLAATRAGLGDDGTIAVRANQRGWPVGWWWEGLTTRRVAVGSDPRWLGFPQERAQAALAARFFSAPLTAPELRALSESTGVRVLACSPREWIGWQRWLAGPDPPVRVLYRDDDWLVMRVVAARP